MMCVLSESPGDVNTLLYDFKLNLKSFFESHFLFEANY